VKITTGGNELLREVIDPAWIAALVAFAEARGDRWGAPWYGPVGASVRANFYVGKRFLGDLGIAQDSLTAQGCGYFNNRRITRQERRVIVQMFAVSDPYKR
jgi:hypothetical protein